MNFDFDWEALLLLIGFMATTASFIFKAGEVKTKFEKEIQRLENIIEKTNIQENATNQTLRYKLENLEARSNLEIIQIKTDLEKETTELKSYLKTLHKKINQLENFLTKTTNFHKRDTNF